MEQAISESVRYAIPDMRNILQESCGVRESDEITCALVLL